MITLEVVVYGAAELYIFLPFSAIAVYCLLFQQQKQKLQKVSTLLCSSKAEL